MKSTSIEYEVIGRAIVHRKCNEPSHSIKLLYRGDGTPWWTCSSDVDLTIPAHLKVEPGDMITLTVTVK